MTAITKARVDRAISAMSDRKKAALLDEHIGPMLPGSTPDAEGDMQLPARRRREPTPWAGRAEGQRPGQAFERRIGMIERQLRAMPDAIGAAMLDSY